MMCNQRIQFQTKLMDPDATDYMTLFNSFVTVTGRTAKILRGRLPKDG